MDLSTPGEELLLVFKIFRGSSDFTLIFKILTRLMQKELQSMLLNRDFFAKCSNMFAQ
jgi:hypothetical protein